MKSIVVFDYGFGNVRSVLRAIEKNNYKAKISNDFEEALNAAGLVIPGVGAFAACLEGLKANRAAEIIDKRLVANRPVLGICVGMQVMFESGTEHGQKTLGLGQWPGEVEELKAKILPHMGFNSVKVAANSLMFQGIESEQFYFLHSFANKRIEFQAKGKFQMPLIHTANYEEDFVAAMEDGPLWATQFHPEKSGAAGLQLIKNWLEFTQ